MAWGPIKEREMVVAKIKEKTEKSLTIAEVVNNVRKRCGAESIHLATELPENDVIPFGNFMIDNDVLAIGGIPKGRIIELYGPESSGKTTLSLLLARSYQKKYPEEYVVFIDLEGGMDNSYLDRLGVDKNKIYIVSTTKDSTAIKMLGAVEEFYMSPSVGLIIIDSVASVAKDDELSKDLSQEVMAGSAQLLSKFLKRSTYKSNGATLIFINQIREKIGVMFGNPEVTPGGHALRHYASGRIRVQRVAKLIEEDGCAVGQRVKITLKKSKFSAPGRSIELSLFFNGGFDEVVDLFELANSDDIMVLTKRGSTYYFGDVGDSENKIAVGKEATIQEMRKSPELFNKIKGGVSVCWRKNINKKEGVDDPILDQYDKVCESEEYNEEVDEGDSNSGISAIRPLDPKTLMGVDPFVGLS